MKKMFENPEISARELRGEDVIMASKSLAEPAGLKIITNEEWDSDGLANIWKGTNGR